MKLVTETVPVTFLPLTVPSTYLPPVVETTRKRVTTTRRPITTTTTQKTTPVPFISRNLVEPGYDYQKPKTFVKDDLISVTYLPPVPSTYLPPVVAETTTRKIITTTRRPITTTQRTTLAPITQRNLFTEKGYDYVKPAIKTVVEDEFLPVTYLPPVLTTQRSTTQRSTTQRTTTPFLRTVSKEGYDYPKPEIRFDLPKPTERITLKAIQVPTVPSTYLPPETTRIITTRTTTTTQRPSTAKIITNYLPPEEPKGYFYDKPSIPFFY